MLFHALLYLCILVLSIIWACPKQILVHSWLNGFVELLWVLMGVIGIGVILSIRIGIGADTD